jgi:hypothetical protein
VVPADSDDNIIGEPVIVDCLVVPFRRFAANRVEEPVDLIQIDVRRQRADDSVNAKGNFSFERRLRYR